MHLFTFLKYVQPTWYFNLGNSASVPYFVDYNALSGVMRTSIDFDHGYSSLEYRLRDAAYQAFQKGIVERDNCLRLIYKDDLSIQDEYRFIRKYFHWIWSIYVLIVRILNLNNPIREVIAFSKNIGVKRVDLLKNAYNPGFKVSASVFVESNPLVSVIIPSLNRYQHLHYILKDLEKQSYRNFEVIVIDQSKPFSKTFYDTYNLNLKVIRQSEPGLWKARNTGVKVSEGEFLAFSEDDVRIKSDWLEEHLKCIRIFNCDISAGVFYPEGSSLPRSRSFYRWAEQFASGNALVRKNVFAQAGLFDLQFEKMRMGDGEFGARCYVKGFTSVSNPFASCIDVKADTGGLREMGSWDAIRPTRFFAPRPIPSVNYYIRKYFGDRCAIRSMLISVPPSIIPYKYKGNFYFTVLSFLIIIILLPFLMGAIISSWRISSIMLRQGAKIEQFKSVSVK